MLYTKSIDELAVAFKNNKIVAYPTEGVFGIGSILSFENAKKISLIKQRDISLGIIILALDLAQIETLVDLTKVNKNELEKLIKSWEIQTTYVFPINKSCKKNLQIQSSTIAIRLVKTNFLQELLQKIDAPIFSTSANIHKKKTPKSIDKLDKEIVDKLDLIYTKHEIQNNKSSKIINFLTKKVIRR